MNYLLQKYSSISTNQVWYAIRVLFDDLPRAGGLTKIIW